MATHSYDAYTKSPEDLLDRLGIIERLEVRLDKIEPHRITATYSVTQKGKEETTSLTYRYEEGVFTPGDPDTLNLAGLISAQVALNYGLFCDDIVFHGLFDRHDRRLIRTMAKNTAREIYVKKFMEPNPFLTDQDVDVEPVVRNNYLRARIGFKRDEHLLGAKGNRRKNSETPPPPDYSRHAVTSSGGKDSLLSFGLLQEAGYEVHPIFINESGRHWFTAINAYRYFQAKIPHTARVWTDADRLFSWMLRHLPFIRRDFSSLRSDEYPIRLWTVALFVFGALPLMRKRGIGRLVMGDEFDTTEKQTFKGITHYDGLYDQSRYFDEALTRFFNDKSWAISQFSLLRPLSEMLIEKVLTERYPALQQFQISCHATHKEEDRVHPCGRCEKCRRIVAMLAGLGVKPTRCGYTPEQIERCLATLETKGVHQEVGAVEHLAFQLHRRGLINQPSIGSVPARERPEIMKLRFHPEISPIEGIPVDLRKSLYPLLLEHAEGTVRRRGRTWVDFDLMGDQAFRRPYPFESAGGPSPLAPGKTEDPMQRKSSYALGELNWPEAKKRFSEVDIALLPVGAIEQHGPHLPLDCDAFDADHLARKVAESCSDPRPLVLPLVSYGVSYHHEDFSGTISVNPETLSQLVYDIGMSAFRHGITKLIIINGHGGNGPALHFAAQMINRDAHIFTCVDTGETSDPDIYALVETPNDVHAGEIETSTTLASRPHLVDMGKAKRFIPRFSSRYLDFTSKRSVEWYAHTSKISASGVLGDPTKGSREKGERIWKMMIDHLVEFVEGLKNMSLDEIYQRRY